MGNTIIGMVFQKGSGGESTLACLVATPLAFGIYTIWAFVRNDGGG